MEDTLVHQIAQLPPRDREAIDWIKYHRGEAMEAECHFHDPERRPLWLVLGNGEGPRDQIKELAKSHLLGVLQVDGSYTFTLHCWTGPGERDEWERRNNLDAQRLKDLASSVRSLRWQLRDAESQMEMLAARPHPRLSRDDIAFLVAYGKSC